MPPLTGFAYSEKALRFLEKAPKKHRPQITKKIDALINNPRPTGSKKLEGVTDGDYPVIRIRSGKYRILYSIRVNPVPIVILNIDNRKDVYRGKG